MRRTIPVAFIYKFPPVKADFSLVVSAVAGVQCTGSFFHNTADLAFAKMTPQDKSGDALCASAFTARLISLALYCKTSRGLL